MAKEKGVKKSFLLYPTPPNVDRCLAHIAEEDGQETASDEEEYVVDGEVVAEGRRDQRAIGEGEVYGLEGVGRGGWIKCGKV